MSDVALLVPAGFAIGLVMGLLGAGGSILTVPALMVLAGLSTLDATTTSLLIVVVSAAVGLIPHLRADRVHLRDGGIFAASGVAASAGAGALAGGLPDDVLRLGFAGLVAVAAVIMLIRRRAGTPVPGRGRAPAWQVVATGIGVGVITGLFGVGGGFIVVPALVLVLGMGMPMAVGTSLVVIVVNATAALLGRIATVDIPWGVAIPFAVAAATGALLAGRLADRIPAEKLTTAFAVLLFVVAGLTGLDAV